MGKLTEKRRRFVDYFLGEAAGNATEAARLAGYKKPGQQGHDLLKNLEIRKAIESHSETRARIMSRDERQELWSRVARGEEDGMDDSRSRLEASKLLGKSQADFVARVDVSHKLDGMTPEQVEAQAVEMFKADPELWERIKAEVEG